MVLYLITTVLLLLCVLLCKFVIHGRVGKVIVAIRDREDRVRFSGYNTALFKAFIFAVAALISALGGVMFTLQVGLASPSLVGIIPSTEIVIYAALGGRLSLVGAIYGTLLIGVAKSYLSENFVNFWQYFMGGLFMGVVLFLPAGLAGLLERLSKRGERS
jgi:urea transport system permease protein